jgi:hypothetical protein
MSIGPSVYEVVKQFVKPTTAAAGDMSWALMKHSDGLECDLFISHGWSEGIFEFISKVLESWPSGTENAYVCFLSNPQNLNIMELVGSPVNSPFAHALRSSKYVLVIPNERESIYSRIWCCYEAFLSTQWEKTIRQGRRYNLEALQHQFQRFLLGIVPGVTLAFSLYMIASKRWLPHPFTTFWPALGFLAIMGQFSAWRYAATTGLFGGGLFGYTVTMAYVNTAEEVLVRVLVVLFMLIFFPSGLVDHAINVEADVESQMLINGYPGSVSQANSSRSEDKDNIMAEIGSHVAEVDRCVRVLIEARMSTKVLQEVSKYGICIPNAGVVSMSMTFLSVCAWITFSILMYEQEENILHLVLSCVTCAIWIGFVVFYSGEKRRFAAQAMNRFMVGGTTCSFIIVLLVTIHLAYFLDNGIPGSRFFEEVAAIVQPAVSGARLAEVRAARALHSVLMDSCVFDLFTAWIDDYSWFVHVLEVVTIFASAVNIPNITHIPVIGPPFTALVLGTFLRSSFKTRGRWRPGDHEEDKPLLPSYFEALRESLP